MARVIQLGIKIAGKPIDWTPYQRFTPLFVLVNNQQVKIMTGIYPDFNTAKQRLEAVRKGGLKDAFIKTVNTTLLHPIDKFHLGDVPAAVYTPPPATTSQATKVIVPREEIPESFEAESAPIRTSPTRTPPPIAAKPDIRGNIKRSSALELQKLLKREGAYTSSLDGYYGPGTQGAYEKVSGSNTQIRKYSLLSTDMSSSQGSFSQGGLQYYINNLPNNSVEALQAFRESFIPVAKAYEAYWYFKNMGGSQEVNNLMNTAIREAYANAPNLGASRFDHTATYAYNDLGQLLKHLRYVQAASGSYLSVPCWMFEQHPKEAAAAFEADPSATQYNVNIQSCGGFLDWQELRVLLSISKDLSGSSEVNATKLAEGQSRQARYYMAPGALSSAEKQAVTVWQQKLVNGIDNWGAKDPMLGDISTAFKLMYYQSQVLLEDYYMNKGMRYKDAAALATATLQAIVGPYMARFV